MLTVTITIGLAYLCFANALAGFDCERPQDLGCSNSNSQHGCCKECIAQIVEDKKKIENWLSNFTRSNPQLSADAIAKYESPNRLDWGHKDLKNCFFCAGQCWNNPDDNTHCQVSQEDPFGDFTKRTRSLPSVKRNVDDIVEKRNVEASCGAAERDHMELIIPGFGKRYHCDVNCLMQSESKAPTPAPTPHPNQIGVDHVPTPMPVFGDPMAVPTPYPGVPVPGPTPPNVIIISTPAPQGMNIKMGLACTKENEVCGMVGNTKLFCKCKVCGFKGDTCAGNASSLSFVAAALALVAAAARFL